jgi:proteic killer suppression protein
MIRSFRHRGLKRLYDRGDRSRIPPELADRIEDILGLLDVAESAADMALPTFRLHPLKGDLEGFWSVRVSGNRRIVFRFESRDVHDVDLLDYH